MLVTCDVKADPIKLTKIAVIDTGISPRAKISMNVCKKGHFDYSRKVPKLGMDASGHGSLVAEIITKNINTADYCLLIYKVAGYGTSAGDMGRAIFEAVRNGAEYINISMGSYTVNNVIEKSLKFAAKKKVKIFLAAGNAGVNLNDYCKWYPTCYKNHGDNVYIVGALNPFGEFSSYTNYGSRIDVYETGEYKGQRGTSFSSPKALANRLNMEKRLWIN